jgi:hypothetical protein
MSISEAERREDKRRTLGLMLGQLGDLAVYQLGVEPTDPGFTDVLPTTWRELLDDVLIDDDRTTFNRPVYRLTRHGWLEALSLSGKLKSDATRERCTRLVQALKDIVKGRNSAFDEYVAIEAVASNTGLPWGWIFNAINSRLLNAVFPNRQWDAEIDSQFQTHIVVSPTFGLTRL